MKVYRDKNCGICGKIYSPTSPKQKYCTACKEEGRKQSDRLRDRKRSRAKNGYKEYKRKCVYCGKEFTTYYSKKKYCGAPACEEYRIKIKNQYTNNNRDKEYLRNKNKSYYNNNKSKCCLSKAIAYRATNPDASEYKPRGKFKNTYSEVKDYIENRGYKLLSKTYINCKSYLVLECPEGHEWKTSFHGFRDNGEERGNRCPICYQQNNYISKPEQVVRDFLENELEDIEVIYNDRNVIGPKELDFYFPKHNLAIEVCGLYWHGEVNSGKSKDYHYDKMMNCFENDIRLITIFEDEIYNYPEVVFSRIRQALRKPERKVYARKCVLKEIDSKTANTFYSKYHLQGKSTALVRYGLFYDNELLGVASLGKIGRQHTSTKDTIELKRFCTLPGVSIVGGIGKVLKQMKNFAKENGYTKIKSYCDMRYANIFKPVYEILGFDLIAETKYTPHYFKNMKRYRNIALRKTEKERLTGKTEWCLRKEQGYDRIWDCGHRTYQLIIK